MSENGVDTREAAKPTILLVDHDSSLLHLLQDELGQVGFARVLACGRGREALEHLESTPVDLLLLDRDLPDLRSEALLAHVASRYPHVRIVVLAADADVATATRCMKLGARDFLPKPVSAAELLAACAGALGRQGGAARVGSLSDLESEAGRRPVALERPHAFQRILTQDPAMLLLFRHVESIAAGSHPVFVSGETGTGKELVARALHDCSGRPGRFVSLNVAGLDDTMFADVLFGHRRGAFTGASGERAGLIEAAAEGTLFFDEIGDLCEASQVKLLRVLQEREYYPHGADRPLPLRARVVAATHKDPSRLRQDFYFRLSAYRADIPPLRKRLGDLPMLVDHLTGLAAKDLGKRKPVVPAELFVHLSRHDFPGNVRELQAMVFDAVARHDGGVLHLDSFLRHMSAHPGERAEDGLRTAVIFPPLLPTLREIEDAAIQEAIERTRGNRSAAARMLGVSRPTLQRRLRS